MAVAVVCFVPKFIFLLRKRLLGTTFRLDIFGGILLQ